jgi:hypothetical protein
MPNLPQARYSETVVEILSNTPGGVPDHHFEQPFMTTYQIAIAFLERFPNDAEQIGLPLGGAGTGQYTSLAQHLGGQLSRIASDRDALIEGGWLSEEYIEDISFTKGGEPLLPSRGARKSFSMFRLRTIRNE